MGLNSVAPKLTHARLLEVLTFDPQTGVFVRRIDSACRSRIPRAGTQAGCVDARSGYSRISIDGEHHWAHRLAWFYCHGEWPRQQIDHINGIRSDNRIFNLRDVSQTLNLRNQRRAAARSKSGIRGVHWDVARDQWKVEISVDNRNVFVGRFGDLHSAQSAYLTAKATFHPGALL